MSIFFKWLLAILAVIVLLVGVLAVVLPLTFDPNDYKEEIQQAVKKETGRELIIGGDIAWTVYPWLGFEVNDVELGDRPGFGDEPMLKIGQASAAVKIMPLFSKQVQIGKITLNDMSARLTRKANGDNNWQDLIDANAVDSSASGGADNKGNDDIQSVTISGIEISNTNIRWNDAGDIVDLTNARVSASGITDNEPFDLKGGFSVDLNESELKGDVNFAGRVMPGADNTFTQVEDLMLGFDGFKGTDADKLILKLEINANVVVNDKNDSVALSKFRFQLHNMKVAGDLDVNSVSDNPGVKGQLEVAEFNLKTLLENLGLDVPSTTNPDALDKLSATMAFSGSTDEVNLQNLRLKLDTSSFSGRFEASNFDTPKLDFELNIDQLNLDDYLPPGDPSVEQGPANPGSQSVSASPGTGATNSKSTSASSSDLSAETFRGYTGGGKFTVGTLIIAGLTATNVSTTMTANGKGLRFYPTLADFYGGVNTADIQLDATGSRPILTISEDLSGVQADGLLQDLTGEPSRLLGTGSMKMNLRTDLSNSNTTRQNLSGDLSLNVLDGAFVGIDIADTLGQVKSLLGKQDESSETLDDDAKTEFASLGLSGLINNGILSSDDFDMSSTLMRATGKGEINLINETINYIVKPVLSENVRGKGRSTLGQLSGIPIPIKITGSLYDPNISIDLVGALSESQKAKLEDKTSELTNKLFDKLLGDDDKNKDKVESQPDDPGVDSNNDDDVTEKDENKEAAKALINSLFGSKKDKQKQEPDGEASPEEDAPEK